MQGLDVTPEYQVTPITLFSRTGGAVEDISLGLAATICGK